MNRSDTRNDVDGVEQCPLLAASRLDRQLIRTLPAKYHAVGDDGGDRVAIACVRAWFDEMNIEFREFGGRPGIPIHDDRLDLLVGRR